MLKSNISPERLLLSVREAASLLNVSERTLWSQSFPRGPIRTVRLGTSRRRLYSSRDLERFIESQQSSVA
jgi:excisionase family DNA binding protein